MTNIHEAVASVYREVLGAIVVPSLQYALEPVVLDRKPFDAQGEVISRFFETVIQIARSALTEPGSPIERLLFSELPSSVGVEYHRQLASPLWCAPAFYRTDQSAAGKIYEIQAPGSGWGDFELLARAFEQLGVDLPSARGFNDGFIRQVQELTGKEDPRVLHLIDNASVPWGMRFFIETTRPSLKYWGYDTDIGGLDIDFVRSHSFFGLAAENYFKLRLEDAIEGRTKFDLPPQILFDQKAPIVLPFDPRTAAAFDDEVRALFPYTALVTMEGFTDQDGQLVSWEEFRSRSSSGRSYFLKYGGPDVSRNWGSRAVYRVDKSNNLDKIDHALADTARGKVWVIQIADAERQLVTYWDEPAEHESTELRTSKVSAFHGPKGFLGAKVMLRDHPKVHGQADTALAIIEFGE